MYYVTMRIPFLARKFGNVERNSHCAVLHITPVSIARLVLDCNGVFAIKAYVDILLIYGYSFCFVMEKQTLIKSGIVHVICET